MRRLSQLVRGFVLTAGLLILVVAGGFAYYLLEVYPARPGPGSGQEVLLEIPRGGGPVAAAWLAQKKGVIRQHKLFAAYLRITGQSAKLQAGQHRVHDDWSPEQVARALTRRGRIRQVRITLREGANRLDLAEQLERQGVVSKAAFLGATEDSRLLNELEIQGESAEGYLFPETYFMEAQSSADDVVRRLVRTFDERVGPSLERHREGVERLGRELLALESNLVGRGTLARHSNGPAQAGKQAVVILAAMVEAETAVAEERPLVAAVLLNRLKLPGFPQRILQIDPTISYGCRLEPRRAASCARGETLTTRHLQDGDNRYNTYVHPGLPPGPIGNPSLSSIEAVLEPAAVSHLYFVANGAGGHIFSDSLREHNQAVQRYRQSLKKND
jgi:UPF0755 protein